jgi:hypothetical protein
MSRRKACDQCLAYFRHLLIAVMISGIAVGFDARAIALRPRARQGARPSGSVGTESRDHAREDFTTARNHALA